MSRPAVKWKVSRSGRRTFTIDMLAVREHVAANTLPDEDRKLIDRVLPGVLKPLARDIALAAVLRGPQGNGYGTENAGKNAGRKPLKGHSTK